MASASCNAFLFGFLPVVFSSFFLFFSINENQTFVSATREEDSDLQHSHYHHVPLGTLFPSSSCSSPPEGRSRNGSLEVVHKHGPCSKLKQHMSSSSSTVKAPLMIPHSEVLELDEERVRAIQSKVREEQQAREGDHGRRTAEAVAAPAEKPLPVWSGKTLGSGDYFVRVSLGTPAWDLSLVFDTGSDITWTQCLPCLGFGTCYAQKEPIFDPSQSSSYSDVPCSSPQCSLISSGSGPPKCSASTAACVYGITYSDKSFSAGNFAKEKLTITPTHVVENFLFGCGRDNVGLFNGTAGLLGLGRNPVSFVQQTSDTFHQVFSYCIPSTASDIGYLTFGGEPASDDITYVAFSSISQGSSFYGVDVTGISVAGDSLSIPSSIGMIIDSGTVITRVPPAAYGRLRDAFRKAMSSYPMADSIPLLDTCYDLSGNKTVIVPKVTLSFRGGVNVDLDASGVVYAVSETQVCLAFAATEHASDVAIIGNVQQKTFEVVYDVGGGKIGFRPHSCKGSSRYLIGVSSTADPNGPNFFWTMIQIYLMYFFIFYLFFKF